MSPSIPQGGSEQAPETRRWHSFPRWHSLIETTLEDTSDRQAVTREQARQLLLKLN